ncbi:MAG: hypothetical protein KTR31_02330 [Myxococcales bacterium]|nr:hypothetical protein [Myxococcales bacterium]
MTEAPWLLCRGRFQAVPGLTAEAIGPNVLRVRVPTTEAVRRLLRKAVTATAFDDALWLVGEAESVQSVGTAEHADHVEVTVVLP